LLLDIIFPAVKDLRKVIVTAIVAVVSQEYTLSCEKALRFTCGNAGVMALS
jgi:hypothetical protein